MKKSIMAAAATAALGSAAAAAPVAVSFAPGSSRVAAAPLRAAAAVVARDGRVELLLRGRVSANEQRFDLRLSQIRAQAVQSRLAALGVPADAIDISYGPGSGQ